MPVKNYLQKVDLTPAKKLQTLVENRRIFNLENCELNVFESYQQAFAVPLSFSDFVITSMIRGKKVMHLPDKPSFDYLPGESVIVPAYETMVIDFPDADDQTPTQCIALAVDGNYVNKTLSFLNQYYNSCSDESNNWMLQFNQYHFSNDNEITNLINKIIRICSSAEPGKDIFADLSLKELLIRLVQTQRIHQVALESNDDTNQSRLHYVLHYIRENLSDKIAVNNLCRKAYLSRNMFFRWFKEQCGVSPLEYINNERIKMAKQLLTHTRQSVTEISMQCGFSDVNYFIRAFKKTEGITPVAYRSCITR